VVVNLGVAQIFCLRVTSTIGLYLFPNLSRLFSARILKSICPSVFLWKHSFPIFLRWSRSDRFNLVFFILIIHIFIPLLNKKIQPDIDPNVWCKSVNS